jgi:hypothetical protein
MFIDLPDGYFYQTPKSYFSGLVNDHVGGKGHNFESSDQAIRLTFFADVLIFESIFF